MCSISKNFISRRAGHIAALRSQNSRPGSLIVAIEEECELGVKDGIITARLGQDERLKKPRRVRKVPFRGTYIWHRLRDEIFRLESFDNIYSQLPNAVILFE